MKMTNDQIIWELEVVKDYFISESDASPVCIDEAIRVIREEDRPQGKWIEETVPVALVGRGNGQYRCSNCQHGDIQAKTQEVPFCWYCGAKMDKKEADNE